MENIQLFSVYGSMNTIVIRNLLLRLQTITREVSTIRDELRQMDSEFRITLEALLDQHDCLTSRADPYSDSGDSLADWRDQQ